MVGASGRGTEKIAALVIAVVMVSVVVALGTIFGSQGPPETLTSYALVPTNQTSSISSAFQAPTYQLSIQLDRPTYLDNMSMLVSGSVSPPPAAPTYVTITIDGPERVLANSSSMVDTSDGNYSWSLNTGSLSEGWVSGTYTVIGNWTAFGQTANATAIFVLSANHP